ncbi:MAG: hypothetical protein FGM62_04975 [Methylobacterium sp.]|nr:hypothetical protein [Methylobacterium sp.]
MSHHKTMTLHFNDGSSMRFSFPEQESHPVGKKLRLAEMLSSNHLVVEADGSLLMFPVASIKYLQFSGVDLSGADPAQLPKVIIQGATLVA